MPVTHLQITVLASLAWNSMSAKCWRVRIRSLSKTTTAFCICSKKNKVTFFHGHGSFVKAVDAGLRNQSRFGKAEEVILGKHIIVATGFNARALPGAAFDEEVILSNDGALRIGAVPKKLGVIGAGVIGLEMGSVWRRCGAGSDRTRSPCRPSARRC